MHNKSFSISAYYSLRPIIPLKVRRFLHRFIAKKIDGFCTLPMWPIPEILRNFQKVNWPENQKASLILTHDVDTRFGFENIRNVCEVEKRLGLKACWNIIPHLYEINESTLRYLSVSGMEIGVHDWNHDGKLFSDKAVFEERIKQINRIIREWKAKGFRAGAVFHNGKWMQRLECKYDSSYYDTDPFQPMRGGCASIWPFMLGQLVELPYTIPQDHVLFLAGMELKVPEENPPFFNSSERKKNWEWIRDWCKENRIKSIGRFWILRGINIWKMKAEWLAEQGGMVLMLTHPEYLCHLRVKSKRKTKTPNDSVFIKKGWLPEDDEDIIVVREKGIIEVSFYGSLLEQYAAFLNWYKRKYGDLSWHCLPREMAEWYKQSVKSEH